MHAKVFDTIIRTTFEASALNALTGIVTLMTLRLVDSLVDRIVSSRWLAMILGDDHAGATHQLDDVNEMVAPSAVHSTEGVSN
ncbi:hypothetical protein [Singulisphaera acidiphila]|uniref:Uncharacterized protein n=1 Tax=Singulisphaera acidiphila (strain ATCC BAA-1392 / DSM 18658 / VKM B-2454 / MOB10) TaxID=886293 RepID=L0DIY4_SINAD|nr:hypothetical protein [Singulisphaera acidiphila]AGA28621.1 hypothetical protein Sinac_4432 [Singulisphaera acidiphila DSM 18658]